MDKIIGFCKQKWKCDLKQETYFACANFLFYTSWYEELLFNKNCQHSPSKDEKIAKDVMNLIDISDFDFFGNHFAERYIDGDKPTTNFNNLHFNRREEIFNILCDFKNHQKRDWKLLWAYISIVYRFRNNMFHGNKGIINLNANFEQFLVINEFMDVLLSKIIDKKYKGYNGRKVGN